MPKLQMPKFQTCAELSNTSYLIALINKDHQRGYFHSSGLFTWSLQCHPFEAGNQLDLDTNYDSSPQAISISNEINN